MNLPPVSTSTSAPTQSAYRQLAPGPSPTSEETGPGSASGLPSPTGESSTSVMSGGGSAGLAEAGGSGSSGTWKKRVSTACLACKKSKRKCSGIPPCDNCRAFNRECIFDESLDQRRRVAAKRTADELTYHRDLLNDLFKVIRAADEAHANRLLEIIRRDASAEEIRGFIDETLASMATTETPAGAGTGTAGAADAELDTRAGAAADQKQEIVHRLEDVRQMLNVSGTGPPSFRRKVMDIHYLCDEAPCKVPAKPWTSVTEDDDLVSHLVSLYFTWDYPFWTFLDRDVFLRHMARGDLESEFCSPFLVNALLANACHFSEFSEAYVVPGDIMTKGADFLAEAERLKQQETARIGLSSLQGTLLLYERARYSLAADDDLGYLMLHQAIRAGESLGLIGDKGLKMIPEQLSYDMDVSLRRTAWGLFHVDTVIHTGFLRPSLINNVNLNRIDRDTSAADDIWIPYPSHRSARPAYLSQYFDEACNLSEIAKDISRRLFSGDTGGAAQRRPVREGLYERLRRWYAALPEILGPGRKPPPYIILLRMRYHTLVINLFACTNEDDVSSITSDAPKTPESPPRQSPPGKYNAWDLTQSSARSIASLARLHRREYGMSRAHHFAMYAINLALFAMLESDTFDILDPDFLPLSSAFSVIASRSHLGRNLFHIFRQSVRAKAQGKRIRESSTVPDELKELFDEDAVSKGHSRMDEYAQGLEKLDRDERYHGIAPGLEPGSATGEEEGIESLQEYPGLGLFDMLDRYESLSLGKDEIVMERSRPEEC